MKLYSQLTLFTLFALAALVSAKTINEKRDDLDKFLYKIPKGFPFAGDATWYNTTGAQGVKGYGSCGELHYEKEFVVALNAVQMQAGWPAPQKNPNKNPKCGDKVEIYRYYPKTTKKVDLKKKVVATIVDTCPPCYKGSIDLSPATFEKIGKLGEGRIQIAWRYVDGKENPKSTSNEG